LQADPRSTEKVALGAALGKALGAVLGKALLLGDALGTKLGDALRDTLGVALELGKWLGAILGEGLGAIVGPKPKVHVSSCVIVADTRLARSCVSKLPTREEPVIISTFPAPKIMPCNDASAPM
jgi:hypothetical protein